ncbi:MAG: helix-turn-helix transcriptional regulator [Clostridia bacterium]|nr:helix-turn-helix transcriptional regulator [Clostridia bacterium]
MSNCNNNKRSNEIVYDSTFGKNLEKLLDQLDILKVDLAKGIGVTKGTITNICKGYNYPHVSTVLKICNYLNVDINLLTNSDPKLKMIGESAEAYSSLKKALVSIGALKEDETIKKEHIELFEKLIKDNKKLYQDPDKALGSEKLIVIPVEDISNND